MNGTAQHTTAVPARAEDPVGRAPEAAGVAQAIARARQGDRQALRLLHARYAPSVRRHVATLLADADAVEDVVRSTFLGLPAGLGRREPGEQPFEAWLAQRAREAASAVPCLRPPASPTQRPA